MLPKLDVTTLNVAVDRLLEKTSIRGTAFC